MISWMGVFMYYIACVYMCWMGVSVEFVLCDGGVSICTLHQEWKATFFTLKNSDFLFMCGSDITCTYGGHHRPS